jgi:hypothetical protein
MADLVLGQKLSDSAREYANVTIAALQFPSGAHPPTVVAACARMAGTYLFRSFGLKLKGAQPGQAVLSVEANEHSPMLIRTTAGILSNLGITIASAPTTALVEEKTKPMHDFLQTQRQLEPLFTPIQSKYGLTTRQAAQAAAIATAILIHHFVKHLEPNAAFGLAALAFIEGSKTAPDPVSLPDNTA